MEGVQVTAAKIKVYGLRVSGPSASDDDEEFHGLRLDHVITALLLLEVGESFTIDCTAEEISEGGLL